MITGDKQETAEAIARETGIDQVIAGVLPDGKVAALDDLRAGGQKVAFVGDDLPDLPVLRHVGLGVAVADLGTPMLSMHSARECAAVADHDHFIALLTAPQSN